MTPLRKMLASAVFGGALAATPLFAAAAPTETTRGGATTVALSPQFLGALSSLNVAPGAIAPGKLVATPRGVRAWFGVTTGVVDLGSATNTPITAEISHEGGLSLSAGATRVELSSFAIEIGSGGHLLTGLAVVNDSLVGRIPLFDLDLSGASITRNGNVLKAGDVAATLNEDAATALNQIFGVSAFVEGFPIGTAEVRALLDNRD
jgi:hypothetical protein